MPSWLTTSSCPATVREPLRGSTELFAATTYDTTPLPSPLAVPEMESHPALLVAVHWQPAGAVITASPLPLV